MSRELQCVVSDLRRVVRRLAGVDPEPWLGTWGQSSRPLSVVSPAESRADAWLTTIEQLIALQPGDKLTIEWQSGDPVVATLSLLRADGKVGLR